MIFQLFEVQAFLSAVTILTFAAGFALALIVIGVASLVARRLTSPDRVKRRRVFRIIGLIFVVPGSLVCVGLFLFVGIVMLWPPPKVDLSWDLSADRSMTQLDLSECSTSDSVDGVQHRCIYEGDITLSIGLPDGRSLEEAAKLVWVDGLEGKLTKIIIYSVRYDLDEVNKKVDAYIEQWQLDSKKFEDWIVMTRAGTQKPLYYWWDDASKTTPSLWLAARHLEGKSRRPWTLELTLHWERL